MAEIQTLTDDTFEAAIKDGLTLVDFWAEWCQPCKMIAPIVEEIAKTYAGKVKVAKLDVDENPRSAMRYRVMSIPTVILFKNGEPVEVWVGAQPKRNYLEKLERHLPTSA